LWWGLSPWRSLHERSQIGEAGKTNHYLTGQHFQPNKGAVRVFEEQHEMVVLVTCSDTHNSLQSLRRIQSAQFETVSGADWLKKFSRSQ
jgi:hypothetical protein